MNDYGNRKKAELLNLIDQKDRRIDRHLEDDDKQTTTIRELREKIDTLREDSNKYHKLMLQYHTDKNDTFAKLQEAEKSITNLKSTNEHLTNDFDQMRDLADNRGKMLNDFEMQMEAVKTMISTSLNHYSLNSEVEDAPLWAGFRSL